MVSHLPLLVSSVVFTSSPLVSSVVFTSSPLVSSVNFSTTRLDDEVKLKTQAYNDVKSQANALAKKDGVKLHSK